MTTATLTQIIDRRATSAGIQSTIEDAIGTEIVTLNNGCASCTCGLEKYCVECAHRRVAIAQEQTYIDEALTYGFRQLLALPCKNVRPSRKGLPSHAAYCLVR